MDTLLKKKVAEQIKDFRLPRYRELPNVGLYLEQVTKYINSYLAPLGCLEITSSMVSNYVKKGVIDSPVKKLYYADQIGYLFVVSIAKNVLMMEDISTLFKMQRDADYDSETAYNYFCTELENILFYICGLKKELDDFTQKNTELKTIFRSVVIAASHIIFLNFCFDKNEKKD